MISKSVLNQAKAFLCWDCFPGLTVQMVSLKTAFSYFLPPSETSTIVLFYEPENQDFTLPLCYLFHEAGHYSQYLRYRKRGTEKKYLEEINTLSGNERIELEKQAWDLGETLLTAFCGNKRTGLEIPEFYRHLKQESLKTYGS